MPRDERPTVYSTEEGWNQKRKPTSLPPQQQTAAILRERKGRGGKTVTVIRDLRLSPDDLKALAAHLKTACGSGGTVKEGIIEIQGDHREKAAQALRALGYKTKFAGG